MQNRNPSELLHKLLSSKKFLAWKPQTIQHKRSNGAVKSYQYKGKTHELPRYSYTNLVDPKRPFEKHFTPAEVAELWGISVDMARDLFRAEDDVLKLERTGSTKYVTLRIPALGCPGHKNVQHLPAPQSREMQIHGAGTK